MHRTHPDPDGLGVRLAILAVIDIVSTLTVRWVRPLRLRPSSRQTDWTGLPFRQVAHLGGTAYEHQAISQRAHS